MNTLKTPISTLLMLLVVCVSCSKPKPSDEQTEKSPADSATVERAVDLSSPPVKNGLSDTVGIYKLTSPEAQAYIVEMYTVISQIDQAVNEKAIARMPGLMNKQSELQRKQVTIQNPLSETDRELFKRHMNKIANKLDSVATKMEGM